MKPLRFSSLSDRAAGTDEPLVVGRQKSELRQQQYAGIKLLAIQSTGDHLAPLVPGAPQDLLTQFVGLAPPMRGAVQNAEANGDPRQPIAGHPAHGRRVGMDALAAAIFPGAGIRLHGESHRLLAERLEAPEQGRIAHARQPLVDEHLRGREDHAAIGVMLQLLCRLVADTDGAVARKSLEVRRDGLIDRIGRHDAVDGPQGPIRIQADIGDVVDVLFHGLRGAKAIERLDDEERITQPAVAVVPIALRARSLRDRGGMRSDDCAGILVVAELQRDGRADDLGLVLKRDGQRTHPVEPVILGPFQELARCQFDGRFEGFVRPQNERDRLHEAKRRLVREVGDGRIRGHAQRVSAPGEAHVVGADRPRGRLAPIVEGRPNADLDARQAGQRLNPAEDLRRIEHPLVALEARREVGDRQCVARLIPNDGLYDRRVAQVAGLVGDRTLHDDVAEALFLVAGQQAREYRIGIEARKAPPQQATLRIPERGRTTIANNGQVERATANALQASWIAPRADCGTR